MNTTVLTVGHSTHSAEKFADLLKRHEVEALADVRAAPWSRFNPQFNRETLAGSLEPHRIQYIFMGAELGGRSKDPSFYDGEGRIDYERLRNTDAFRRGLDQVVQDAERRRIALMCAEREPLACHRVLLIAPALEARGVGLAHIRADGDLESHADAMERLLQMHKMTPEGLFPGSRAERIRKALDRQARRFGHRSKK